MNAFSQRTQDSSLHAALKCTTIFFSNASVHQKERRVNQSVVDRGPVTSSSCPFSPLSVNLGRGCSVGQTSPKARERVLRWLLTALQAALLVSEPPFS